MAQLMHAVMNPAASVIFFASIVILLWLAYRRRLRWRPALLLRLILIGLVIIGVFAAGGGDTNENSFGQTEVMIIDQSDSLADEARRSAWQQGIKWQTETANRMLVVFGVGSEASLSAIDRSDGAPIARIDGRASDLDQALLKARYLLAGKPGRIIIVSDGLAARTDSIDKEIADLTAAGVRLDAQYINSRGQDGDLAIVEMSHPKQLWTGSVFDLWIRSHGLYGDEMDLSLEIDGVLQQVQVESMGNGLHRVRMPAEGEGLIPIRVAASDPEGVNDPVPENNAAYSVLRVLPAPRALLITADPGADAVRDFLIPIEQTGVQMETRSPAGLPTDLEALRGYQVVFIHNLLANQLSREQMIGLQVYVSRQAGGLIFLGGRSSYTLGGYADTLLEPMLPVQLEPPARSERPPMVFQLVLDRSASMEMRMNTETPPIALAREAAMRLIETLQADDYLGVLTFSDDPVWEVPVRMIGSNIGLRQALDTVSQIRSDGGTQMFIAVQEALFGMMELPADAPINRHMLILSDGQSLDGTPDEFKLLAETAQAQGITISTIALGGDADTDLMEEIAAAGKGRHYFVQDAGDLPRILISESDAARSENVQSGESRLKPVESGHPVLTGIPLDQLPALNGYNSLTSKSDAGAEDILVSANYEDPVLSVWQYGLGKVAAWTTDLGEEWLGDWPAELQGLFWSQLLRYVLVDPASGPAQVLVTVEPDRIRVEAAVFTADGDPQNQADIKYSFSDEHGAILSYPMNQAGPGVYMAEFDRPPDGAYRAVLTITTRGGDHVEVPVAFAVNPPLEWMPVDAQSGRANLETWVRAAGGQILEDGALSAAEPTSGDAPVDSGNGWLRLLLMIIVLYWPIEILIRRYMLPWI